MGPLGQLLLVLLLAQPGVLPGNGALGHRQDGEAAAALVALLDFFGKLIHIVGDLRDEDDVRAAGDARVQRQPAYLVAHDLHDEDAPVGGGGGVDAVDGLGSHVHRALEAEGHVRAPQVVVDGLGQGDDVQALGAQEVGSLMGAVAPQDDQAVQLELVVGLLHGRNLVHPVLSGYLDGLEGCAAGPQERASLGQDAGKVGVGQQLEPSVDQSLVAVLKTVDLHLFSRVEQRLGDAPHGRVQGLTVPAAGQHTDPFHGKALLRYFPPPQGMFLPCLLYSGLGRSTSGKWKRKRILRPCSIYSSRNSGGCS